MTKQPPKIEDEPGAEERFRQGVANALRMPPQPKQKPSGESRRPAKPAS